MKVLLHRKNLKKQKRNYSKNNSLLFSVYKKTAFLIISIMAIAIAYEKPDNK